MLKYVKTDSLTAITELEVAGTGQTFMFVSHLLDISISTVRKSECPFFKTLAININMNRLKISKKSEMCHPRQMALSLKF